MLIIIIIIIILMIIIPKNRISALNLLPIFYNFANIWHGQILAVEVAKLWRMGRAEWRKIGSLMLPIGHNSAGELQGKLSNSAANKLQICSNLTAFVWKNWQHFTCVPYTYCTHSHMLSGHKLFLGDVEPLFPTCYGHFVFEWDSDKIFLYAKQKKIK